MRKPAAISIGFHAAILLAALVVLPTPKPFEVKPVDAIQVDISTITNKTQQMATAQDAKPDVVKPAPKETKIVKDVPPAPKVADEVKTAANEPTPPPETKPEPPKPPKPDPPKPVEPTPPDPAALDKLLKKVDQPPPEPKPDPTPPKPVEAKKVEKKKPVLKIDDIAAFLDKQKGEKTAPAKPNKVTGAPKQAAKNAQGQDAAVTATLINALTSKVKGCFNVPPAARDANISVRIHFLLNQDGSVNGQPDVASVNSDPIFDATARAAVSAILECQNYDLPKDQYDLWKDNTLDFNPNLLFGT